MYSFLKIRFRAWMAYRRTYRELASLYARELDDLGIAPSQISEVARRAVYH